MSEKTDWFRIINDLERTGLTLRKLGLKVNANATTIFRWKQSIHEPPHSKGEALLKIYRSINPSS